MSTPTPFDFDPAADADVCGSASELHLDANDGLAIGASSPGDVLDDVGPIGSCTSVTPDADEEPTATS